jgi:hypothetical protein
MVFPMMLAAAAIGAGGNILGGLLGSKAQDKANEQNYQIALLNYYNQIEQQRQAQYEARRQEGESKLGSTDYEGSSVQWVPGKGWVQTLGDAARIRQDAYNKEEIAQLQDLQTKRQQGYRTLARQGRQGNQADALYQAMARNYRRDPSEAIGRKNRMTTEAANEGFDTALRNAMVDNIRTGGGNQAKIASQFGRDKFNALRKAFMENAEGAVEGEENRYMTEQGNYENMANPLAQMAGQPFDAAYNPRGQDLSSLLQMAMGAGGNASSRLQSAMSTQAPGLDFKHEPNMGIATTIAQAGSSLAGAMNYYDATRGGGMTNYSNYSQRGYYPPAPGGGSSGVAANMYKGNVGLF